MSTAALSLDLVPVNFPKKTLHLGIICLVFIAISLYLSGIIVSHSSFPVKSFPFSRLKKVSTITISLASNTEGLVWWDRQFIDNFHIVDITPKPDQVLISDSRIYYRFLPSNEDFTVSYRVVPSHLGLIRGRVGSFEWENHIWHIIYP